jgi:hypothetical protein
VSTSLVGRRFAWTPLPARRGHRDLATHWDFEGAHRPACPKTRRTKRAKLTRNVESVTCRDCRAFLERLAKL